MSREENLEKAMEKFPVYHYNDDVVVENYDGEKYLVVFSDEDNETWFEVAETLGEADFKFDKIFHKFEQPWHPWCVVDLDEMTYLPSDGKLKVDRKTEPKPLSEL